jgi:hypothetical protein
MKSLNSLFSGKKNSSLDWKALHSFIITHIYLDIRRLHFTANIWPSNLMLSIRDVLNITRIINPRCISRHWRELIVTPSKIVLKSVTYPLFSFFCPNNCYPLMMCFWTTTTTASALLSLSFQIWRRWTCGTLFAWSSSMLACSSSLS